MIRRRIICGISWGEPSSAACQEDSAIRTDSVCVFFSSRALRICTQSAKWWYWCYSKDLREQEWNNPWVLCNRWWVNVRIWWNMQSYSLEGDCLIGCDELFLVGWVIDGDLLEPALPIILKSSNPRSFALSIIVNILVLDGLSFAVKPRNGIYAENQCVFFTSA